MDVSVVVPVYRGQETISELCTRISQALRAHEFEVILVDDASDDESWKVILGLTENDKRIRGLRMGRNSGQHAALLAGVRVARAPITVTLDDDLQNPPEAISQLITPVIKKEAKVVYGVPSESSHSAWRRFSSKAIRSSMNSALGIQEAVTLSSFRAFQTDLRLAFEERLGPGVSLDSLLAWGTSDFQSVIVDHDPRRIGKSNYSIRKLVSFAIDTITGYSTRPLRFVSLLGFGTAVGGIILLAIFVLLPFAQGVSVQGFPFLASTIIFFSGVQLVTLGVVGEYLAKMHFRIMNKPEYLVVEKVNVD